MRNGPWRWVTVALALLAGFLSRGAVAAQSPPDPAREAASLLSPATFEAYDLPDVAVRTVSAEGDTLTVCLNVPIETLAAEGWLGVERVIEAVRRALTDVAWQQLSVEAWDEGLARCRSVSEFAPRPSAMASGAESAGAFDPPLNALVSADARISAAAFPASLAGKTVYVSAGHGWQWNGTQWRTQRPVYQGFIEDHNNAEAVTQYLIPYLERAGATVIPVRERDWRGTAVVVDDDQGAPAYTTTGAWTTGGSGTGYAGSAYQYANSVTQSTPTAVATWRLTVPAAGTYAVYAWVYPGSNRVPDAHYTVHHAEGATEVWIDQRAYPRTWRYLGTFPFHAGTAIVTLDNRTTASGGSYAVIADALRLGGGTFNTLSGLTLSAPGATPPSAAPYKPWWETSTFYWSQSMGLNPSASWIGTFNDVVARPYYARWIQHSLHADAVYVSWHTNGYNGTARGTVSYAHSGSGYPRTPGSLELRNAVHAELVRDIRAGWDAGWTDRGTTIADLGELRLLWDPDDAGARIPGALFEIAFHDNPEDAAALKEPAFNQLAARAVYQGIVAYFENRDGVDLVLAPEPPTHLRVQNVGSGALRVAWSPSPTDGVGLRGEAATGYRIYTSPDGFGWGAPIPVGGTETTLTGFAPGQTVYVRVTATNAGGESFPTETLGARIGNPDLLLVNGFDRLDGKSLVVENDPVEKVNLRMWIDQMNSGTYVVHHGQAIPSDYAWDSASNGAVMAGAVDLTHYTIVDWILGEESEAVDHTFNATERSLLTAYLAGGRSLLVSGSEFAWELEAKSASPDFLHTQLCTDYIADDAGTYTVRPTANGVFAGLGDLHFDAPGEYDVDWPDVLAPYPGSGGETALTYVGGTHAGQGAAVQVDNGSQRLLVLGFPLESLRPAERPAVMDRALAFLDCGLDTAILSPEEGRAYPTSAPLSGTASGCSLARVELQLRFENGLYWSGGGWTSSPSWFTAYGSPQAWSSSVMQWEGGYTLSARAVDAYGIVDATPAVVTFTVDLTAPPALSVVTPTGGVLLQTPFVELVWTTPPDDGSPLHFEVEVDNRLYTGVPGSPFRIARRRGMHTWRVRAVDAAGNIGPWTKPLSSFEVDADVEEAFLPIIMRR